MVRSMKNRELNQEPIQPEVNIGTLGHVDNGKSTLVESFTSVWTGRHSEERRRGITIRIGYADASIYKCAKCRGASGYSVREECPNCSGPANLLRRISFVDCPGHHSLMVTMLSGAAVMDGALFVIASNVKCPQAQDREHLLAAEMAGLRKLIIMQNKIDVVSKERAVENFREIEKFVDGTIAKDAPMIPVSAQHGTNLDVLAENIEKHIKTPKRDLQAPPRMYVLRSFDVNRPGTDIEDLSGGVLGGSIMQGVLRIDDEIEVRPGIAVETAGKKRYENLKSKITSLNVSQGRVKEAKSGGLVGVGTYLDPSLTKSDGLVGNVIGRIGTLPPVLDKITLDVKLFERAVGTEQLVPVEKIKTSEPLVMNVNTAVTSGVVTSAREDIIDVSIKKPLCVDVGSKIAISRRIGESWRLIGQGEVKG